MVLEFGFWARAERDEMRRAARAIGVPVELHRLTATVDELTRELVDEYAAIFEAPDDADLALVDPPPERR